MFGTPILHEFNFCKSITPEPDFQSGPPPLKIFVLRGSYLWMRKSTLYRGGGVFFENFSWQLQKCKGIPKLLTKVVDIWLLLFQGKHLRRGQKDLRWIAMTFVQFDRAQICI